MSTLGARLPASLLPLLIYVTLLPLGAFYLLRRWKRRNMLVDKVVVYRAGKAVPLMLPRVVNRCD